MVTGERISGIVWGALALALFVAAGCGSSQGSPGGTGGAAGATTGSGGSSGAAGGGARGGTTGKGGSGSAGTGAGGQVLVSGSDAAVDSGGADATTTCGPLVAMGDEITDTTTGLSWSRTAQSSETYGDAMAACAKWGGRLPTEAELVAFANTSRAAVSTCGGVVVVLLQPWPSDGEPQWTTTPDTTNPNFHEAVYNDGTTTVHPENDGVPYICVKP